MTPFRNTFYINQRYVIYTILCILYLLSFGIFNSILRDYHRVWLYLIMAVTLLGFFISSQTTFDTRKNWCFKEDFLAILIVVYLFCLFLNFAFHYVSLTLLEEPIFLNVRLMNVKDWLTRTEFLLRDLKEQV